MIDSESKSKTHKQLMYLFDPSDDCRAGWGKKIRPVYVVNCSVIRWYSEFNLIEYHSQLCLSVTSQTSIEQITILVWGKPRAHDTQFSICNQRAIEMAMRHGSKQTSRSKLNRGTEKSPCAGPTAAGASGDGQLDTRVAAESTFSHSARDNFNVSGRQ